VVVVILRTFLGSVFGGGLSGFLYSIVGGLFSVSVMWFMYKKMKHLFSIPAISITGALCHNMGQILIAALVVENFRLFYYLPVLMASAIVTGLMIGFTVQYTAEPLCRILKIGIK
jgi:heptaprenyl diphosphate synthase